MNTLVSTKLKRIDMVKRARRVHMTINRATKTMSRSTKKMNKTRKLKILMKAMINKVLASIHLLTIRITIIRIIPITSHTLRKSLSIISKNIS